MSDPLGLPEHIETLFKVEAPISEMGEGYFGYKGVLLRDTKEDLVQCHMCGKWFQYLDSHIRQTHKMKNKAYRKKFGLPLKFPLCNRRLSAINRATLLANIKKYGVCSHKKLAKYGRKVGIKNLNSKEAKANHAYSYKNASWDNKKGACPEQLAKRYVAVAEIVGHDPSKLEIERYDPPLYSMIYRRGMTLNKFRKNNNFKVVEAQKGVSNEKIIAALRRVYKDTGSIPRPMHFKTGSPTRNTIVRRFGSWRRALMVANVIE